LLGAGRQSRGIIKSFRNMICTFLHLGGSPSKPGETSSPPRRRLSASDLRSLTHPKMPHIAANVVPRKWLDNVPSRSAGILPADAAGTAALHCPLN
jgi:hypothetical protein